MTNPKVKSIIIPDQLYKPITEICEKYGLSRSEFVRQCILKELLRYWKKGETNEQVV